MPDIVCPECGQVSRVVAIRRAAEEFCTHCDYPLFWAPTAVAMATPGVSSETTMRRLPGAGGRQRDRHACLPRVRRAQRAQRDLLHPLRRRPRSEARATAPAASTTAATRSPSPSRSRSSSSARHGGGGPSLVGTRVIVLPGGPHRHPRLTREPISGQGDDEGAGGGARTSRCHWR